ncbi:uncharacterized protein [Watersipora subatra]|uniref:uncharacterized protein n=1 Tax=Watersipora subatra TaxID=2589382 RepID=UPI00355B1BF7
MLFSILSASEYYQKSMEMILGRMDRVICLMDDVLIVSQGETIHWKRLNMVLSKIEAAGVGIEDWHGGPANSQGSRHTNKRRCFPTLQETLRKHKCEFGCTSAKFLRHLVRAEGVARPGQSKINLPAKSPRR